MPKVYEYSGKSVWKAGLMIQGIYDLEQFILNILIRYKEMDLRDLKVKIFTADPRIDDKTVNYQINVLRDNGFIDIIESESEELKLCIEKAKNDKRVKNPTSHCKRKHPILVKVKINDAGRVKYAHNCYCLSRRLGNDHKTALRNMKLCEEFANIHTTPPSICP